MHGSDSSWENNEFTKGDIEQGIICKTDYACLFFFCKFTVNKRKHCKVWKFLRQTSVIKENKKYHNIKIGKL